MHTRNPFNRSRLVLASLKQTISNWCLLQQSSQSRSFFTFLGQWEGTTVYKSSYLWATSPVELPHTAWWCELYAVVWHRHWCAQDPANSTRPSEPVHILPPCSGSLRICTFNLTWFQCLVVVVALLPAKISRKWLHLRSIFRQKVFSHQIIMFIGQNSKGDVAAAIKHKHII